MHSDALISDCGRYRYWLARSWSDEPRVVFVMLNPSTADARLDDPTIRRCLGFARTWGAGGLVVVNLFALRATNPAALLAVADPVGPDNDAHLIGHAGGCALNDPPLAVVAAWGAKGTHLGRDRRVVTMLRARGVHLQCLGKTAEAHPRHPLYVRGDAPLVPFGED